LKIEQLFIQREKLLSFLQAMAAATKKTKRTAPTKFFSLFLLAF
jgi:hypothetical protein